MTDSEPSRSEKILYIMTFGGTAPDGKAAKKVDYDTLSDIEIDTLHRQAIKNAADSLKKSSA